MSGLGKHKSTICGTLHRWWTKLFSSTLDNFRSKVMCVLFYFIVIENGFLSPICVKVQVIFSSFSKFFSIHIRFLPILIMLTLLNLDGLWLRYNYEIKITTMCFICNNCVYDISFVINLKFSTGLNCPPPHLLK